MSDDTEKRKKIRDIRQRLGRATSAPAKADPDSLPPPPSVLPSKGLSEAPPAGAASHNDPFAAAKPGAVAQSQELRIVVDEQAMSAAREGSNREARRMMLIVGAAALVIGGILGLIATNTVLDRRSYNAAVRDGKEIYSAVQEASTAVEAAKVLLDRASTAANGTAAQPPRVDFAALEELRALPVPFTATAFAGKALTKINHETVQILFIYTRQVEELWDRFDRLANASLPPQRRQELTDAAKDQDAVSSSPTGCVPVRARGGISCNLVFVELGDDAAAGKAKVRSRRAGQAVEKQLFSGQDLGQNPTDFVILTDSAASQGVLGQRENAFVEFRKELDQLSRMMGKTREIQGRLETELGNVATLKALMTP